MSTPFRCDECHALLHELRAALYGGSPSPKREAELREHSEVFSRMLEGSEEAADELFAKYSFRANSPEMLQLRLPDLSNPRVKQALRKIAEHFARTGHLGLLHK